MTFPALSSRRSFSTGPSLLAPFQYTTLPDRNLLQTSNRDSPKFLQGLISNDINRIVKPKEGVARAELLYAGMLKADVS